MHEFSNYCISSYSCRGTILFWMHLGRKLFKFSFPLCNENLNSFLTRWGNYLKRGNYSREETIWGNTVYVRYFSKKFSPLNSFCSNAILQFIRQKFKFAATIQIFYNLQQLSKFSTISKGQLISKANQSSRGFSQKTNENTSHSSKNEFIRSFFGRILGLTVCFRN